MSLSTAMLSALSGLRASEAGLTVVSNNVANAGSANYTRKTLDSQEQVAGGSVVGVQTGQVTRVLDMLVQRQMWTESAGGSYTSTKASYASSLDDLFGQPGGDGSLDTVFNNFTQSLQSLSASPDDYSAQQSVVSSAQLLAEQLNGMSSSIQTMRDQTESSLSTDVDAANTALQNIQNINTQIIATSTNGVPSAALLDERDGYISQLSSLMDIKVVQGSNNNVSIFTSTGALLFDGQAAKLNFDSHGLLGPNSQYSTDPSQRNVGTITLTSPSGYQVDMIGSNLIRSGEIGALIDLRDNVLPQAQNQLDTIASQMSQALSDTTVAGTAATGTAVPPGGTPTGYSVDLTGQQDGNPISLSYTTGGATTKVQFVRVAAGTTLPLPKSANGGVAGLQVVGYTGDAATAINAYFNSAGLGSKFTASSSGNTLTLLNDGSTTSTIGSLSAQVTATSTSGGTSQLPLFVDADDTPYTGSFDGGSERTGYAARISVNSAVVDDPSLLVKSSPTTAAGDVTRPNFILNALTATKMSPQPDTGIGSATTPFSGTVGDFVRQVVSTQGANAAQAQSVDDGQQVVVNQLADKMTATSGVDVDTEMSNLLQLQNAYSANARVMSTIKDMLATLMNM